LLSFNPNKESLLSSCILDAFSSISSFFLAVLSLQNILVLKNNSISDFSSLDFNDCYKSSSKNNGIDSPDSKNIEENEEIFAFQPCDSNSQEVKSLNLFFACFCKIKDVIIKLLINPLSQIINNIKIKKLGKKKIINTLIFYKNKEKEKIIELRNKLLGYKKICPCSSNISTLSAEIRKRRNCFNFLNEFILVYKVLSIPLYAKTFLNLVKLCEGKDEKKDCFSDNGNEILCKLQICRDDFYLKRFVCILSSPEYNDSSVYDDNEVILIFILSFFLFLHILFLFYF
jgi:hypothetical protein